MSDQNENITWADTVNFLCPNSAAEKLKKCSVRLLDTIFIGQDLQPQWYFTTKSGFISKKKENSSNLSSIVDRFSKFALANPNNIDGTIGVFVQTNGFRQRVTKETLTSLLDGNLNILTLPGAHLQVYLRPFRGEDCTILCQCTRSEYGEGEMLFKVLKSFSGRQFLPIDDKNIKDQIIVFAKEIMKHFLKSKKVFIESFDVECILDDNGHLWLSTVPNVTTRDPDSDEENNPNLFDDSPPKTPKISPRVDQSALSGLPSVRGSIDSVVNNNDYRPSSGLALSTITNINSTNGLRSNSASSEFISKEGNVYICSIGMDDLPGLQAWTLTSMSTGSEVLNWSIEMNEYNNISPKSPNPAMNTIIKQRSSARQVVPYKFIALLRNAESILLGRVDIRAENDFELLWQKIYEQTITSIESIKLSNEVVVCGNLHAICKKLESLISIGFRSTNPIVNKLRHLDNDDKNLKRPQSEASLRKDAEEDSSRPSSGSRIGSRLEVKNSSKSTSKECNSNKSNTFLNDNNDEFDSQMKEAASILEKKTLKLKTAYDENSKQKDNDNAIKSSIKQIKKKKKSDINEEKNLAKAPSLFKRALDQPPNLEMIAKFAAEKEKHLKQLNNKNREELQGDEDDYDYGEEVKKTVRRKGRSKLAYNGADVGHGDKVAKKKNTIKSNDYNKNLDEPVGMSDEMRLAELEMYAYNQSQIQQNYGIQNNMQGQSNGYNQVHDYNQGKNSLAQSSVISTSESEYMLRAAQNGEVSQLSLFEEKNSFVPTNGGGLGFGNDSIGSLDSVGAGIMGNMKNQLNSALKERVEQLDKQVASLTGQIERKEEEQGKTELKLRRVVNELENVRKAFTKEIQLLRENHEKTIIQMQVDFGEKMATIAGGPIDKSDGNISDEEGNYNKSKKQSDIAFEGNRQLVEQLEVLRVENKKLQDNFVNERRMLQIEYNTKSASQEKLSNANISVLRSKITSLEDLLLVKDDNIVTGLHEIENLKSVGDQLEQARKAAVEVQNKLRADLKNMQQSVAASYRLESTQGIGVGLPAETAIRLSEATSEAKVRQLTNKVDFLKSQLSAEQAAMEEMKIAVEESRLTLEEMKDEFRTRLQEVEKMKRKAITEAEQRIEASYEERMTELTTLQTKFQSVTGQLNEAYAENQIAKQREDAAKAQASKALAYQSQLRVEADEYLAQINEMREDKEKTMNKDSNKHNQDAIIRRLDNERQYLKSQLGSEITLKTELQTTLNQCQSQLSDVQRQWKIDVDTLKEKLSRDSQESIQNEQVLHQRNVHLEGEINRTLAQNKDLKEGFNKARDQVRMEQLANENANSTNRRLNDQMESIRADLSHMRKTEEETSKFHEQQITALKDSLEEQQARKQGEIEKLKTELSLQYRAVSDGQRESLELRKLFEIERVKVLQRTAAGNIMDQLRKMRRGTLATGFRIWNTNSTLIGVAEQFRGHVNDLVKETLDEAKEDKNKTSARLRKEFDKEKEIALNELQLKCDKILEKSLFDAEENKNAELDQLREEFSIMQENEKQHFLELMDEEKNETDANLQKMFDRNEKHMDELKRRQDRELEMKEKETIERIEIASHESCAITTAEFELKIKEIRLELAIVQEKAIEANNQFHDNKMKNSMLLAHKELEAVREALEAEKNKGLALELQKHKIETEELIAKLNMEYDVNMKQVVLDNEQKFIDFKQEYHEASEKRIRELDVAWTEEKLYAFKQKDKECDEKIAEKMEAYMKSVEGDRARGMKLEASKWKQALKDAEKRFELEIGKAKADGRADIVKEAKIEKDRIETNNSMTIQLLNEKFRLELQSNTRDFEQLMSEMKSKFENELRDAVKKTEISVKSELDEEWAKKLKKSVDEAWFDAGQIAEDKINKSNEKIEKFKRELINQTQHITTERNDLLNKVNANSEVTKRMEDIQMAERQKLINDFEDERQRFELLLAQEKKNAINNAAKDTVNQLEECEAKNKALLLERLRTQKESLTQEMDNQMTQLQNGSDKLITGLETAMDNLKSEKNSLIKELEATATKLEDTEDSLYDCQQDLKKKDKELSLLLWKSMTDMGRMQTRFKKGLEEFDKETLNRIETVRKQCMHQVNNVTLVAMKLQALVAEVEVSRKKTHAVLTTHKVQGLAMYRTKIKMIEKDLERLTMEKDQYEETRDVIEDEVAQMESQVRDLEDQIREHNRSSSMQNGRVNVAHARKKRRLDSELERILEGIEQKRANMGEFDDKAAEKSRQRDEKEMEMIDLEKQLVQILVEQQKLVLGIVEDNKFAEEKAKIVGAGARLPWPPVAEPTIQYVHTFYEKENQ